MPVSKTSMADARDEASKAVLATKDAGHHAKEAVVDAATAAKDAVAGTATGHSRTSDVTYTEGYHHGAGVATRGREMVQDAANTIRTKSAEARDAIVDKAEDVKDAVADKAADVKDAVAGAASSAGNVVSRGVHAIGDGISAAAHKVGDAAVATKDAVASAATTVRDAAYNATHTARDAAVDAKDAVRDTAIDAKNAVRDTAIDAKNTVRDAAADAKYNAEDVARRNLPRDTHVDSRTVQAEPIRYAEVRDASARDALRTEPTGRLYNDTPCNADVKMGDHTRLAAETAAQRDSRLPYSDRAVHMTTVTQNAPVVIPNTGINEGARRDVIRAADERLRELDARSTAEADARAARDRATHDADVRAVRDRVTTDSSYADRTTDAGHHGENILAHGAHVVRDGVVNTASSVKNAVVGAVRGASDAVYNATHSAKDAVADATTAHVDVAEVHRADLARRNPEGLSEWERNHEMHPSAAHADRHTITGAEWKHTGGVRAGLDREVVHVPVDRAPTAAEAATLREQERDLAIERHRLREEMRRDEERVVSIEHREADIRRELRSPIVESSAPARHESAMEEETHGDVRCTMAPMFENG